MKKLTLSIIFLATLIVSMVGTAKAQTFELTIEQKINTVAGVDYLDISLYIKSTSSDFSLGSSEFVVDVNGSALDVAAAQLLTTGMFAKEPSYYRSQTLIVDASNSFVGTAIDARPGNLDGAPYVPKTATLIATIRIPITDPSMMSEVDWNISETVVVQADRNNRIVITGSGTFITPATFPLPVELISFTATAGGENTVLLNWATASETNNSHFDVEHSTTGSEWVTAGIVVGNGTSTARHNYSFTHYNNNTGTVYYRLRQVDYNGEFEYSPVRSVSYTGEGTFTAINITPNPTLDRAEISVKGYTGRFNATFFNTTGQQVNVYQGNGSQLVVPVSEMKSGVYIVRITSVTGELLGTQRLVIGR